MDARSNQQSPGWRGDTTECSTSHSSKCKHLPAFPLAWAPNFGQEKRTQSHGGPAVLLPLPSTASKFLTRSGRTAAGSGHRRVLHLVENPLSSPVLSQPPKHCQESAQSSHSLFINVDGGRPWTCRDTRFPLTPAGLSAHFMPLG